MKRRFVLSLLTGLPVLALLGLTAPAALAGPITFSAGQYDNTANTVTSGPVTHNNQTTGQFRDTFWWSLNNGQPRVGSGDYINQGNSLVLCGNSACPGSGPYTALNFTGPSVSGGQSYLSVYDTTVADGDATQSLLNAIGGLTITTDVLFVKHNVSAGVVMLYDEGMDGLALLANNRDGNNTDYAKLDLVWQSQGTGTVLLSSAALPAATFDDAVWYRIVMALQVTGNTWSATGSFYNHTDGTNPNSALGALITSLSWTGSLSTQSLTNPGEVGLIAMGNESISLPDNVGVSFTNVTIPDGQVPEPASMLLLGSGLLGLGGFYRRRKP